MKNMIHLGIGDIGLFSVGRGEFELGILVGFRDHRTFNCTIKFPGREEQDVEDHYPETTVHYAVLNYKNLSG